MNLFSIAPLTKVELGQLNYTILLSSCDLLFSYLDGLDTLILCGLLDLMGDSISNNYMTSAGSRVSDVGYSFVFRYFFL